MNITIRTDANKVYADAFDFTPGAELYIELRSKAVLPNESTVGATAALHTTADANGTCHFRVPRAALLLDTSDGEDGNLPREITAIGPITTATVTA